ncbi:MAG: 50S ribosomal protein L3 [Spirochaetes bacterium]|nr:50S ribosomal protein L3 [Spirochaetota bacterium]
MLGLVAKKAGMTQLFSEEGNLIPVTVIKVDKNIVINKRNKEKDGYNALILGVEDLKENKASKPYLAQFKDNVKPKRYLKEFSVENPDQYQIGQEIGLEIFNGIKYVDVIGQSKGKGYQGVMKRHGFGGGPSTHGSKMHRHNGSTGQNSYPSRVFKGLKRAGRMGNDRVTVLNLKVVDMDVEKNLIMVKGSIPGNKKNLLYIRKAVKK